MPPKSRNSQLATRVSNRDPQLSHKYFSENFLKDENQVDWHNNAVWFFRQKRDAAAAKVREWESLRDLGSQIKEHTLSHLDQYLEQFEKNAIQNGVQVHWAADANEHNEIVAGILKKNEVTRMVKSKSMLTEECGLNEYLIEKGIEVVDTDLGERIIQMRDEPPSHIVAPAIHLKKEDIGELFHRELKTEQGNSDPKYLTEAARGDLRKKFIKAQAALTGVNFGIAETGGVVVCTNEGNADMGVHLAPVQIHCMGIEKMIPRLKDLGVFTRLLARSGTGQPITIFTSHYHRPKSRGEMHIVIVDNGRSRHLGRKGFSNALKCIRCGACLNTCPVYRRSGGYSYRYTISGPIGSVLTPGIDLEQFQDLPFASSLCGSCSNVCPVKIDLHEQLYNWRQVISESNPKPRVKKWISNQVVKILSRPAAYRFWTGFARWAMLNLPRGMVYNRFNVWGKQRELPDPPVSSFKNWYRKNRM